MQDAALCVVWVMDEKDDCAAFFEPLGNCDGAHGRIYLSTALITHEHFIGCLLMRLGGIKKYPHVLWAT